MMLCAQRIAELQEKRAALVAQMEELKASAKVQRFARGESRKRGHPTSWRQTVQSLEDLIAQIDKVLRPLLHKQSEVTANDQTAVSNESASDVVAVLARLARTAKTETRVTVRSQAGRNFVDVRVWRLTEGDPIPTLKGVRIAANQLDAILAGMQSAQQYTVAER
jgi:hypothetical protein